MNSGKIKNPCTMELPELEMLVAYHNDRYWNLGEPEISDEAYDTLLIELRNRNPLHPLLHRIFKASVLSDGKVKLAEPMLSLDKAYSMDEVISWADKYARNSDELFLAQPKYDGISAYFDGTLLATRGDGETGENVTGKIPLIELETRNWKGKLNQPVRGEIVIRNDDFSTLYPHILKRDGNTYKNSRNAVAGIMGLKDISDMLRQNAKLTLIDYEFISTTVNHSNLAQKFAGIIAEVEALPYPTDGVVFKLADREYANSLGSTAHHPRGQIAFKFSGIRRKTELLQVEWSFGKSALTPVAELTPVEIGGVTIKRATLHNAQNVIDMDIKLHDMVTIERAGDVIPYIIGREEGENRLDFMIQSCPGCQSSLVRKGPELCCVNPECFETNLQKLTAAVKSIGIQQLGEPTIRKMMTVLNIRTLTDIFRITEADILGLESFAEKSAKNLCMEIETARKTTDFQFLTALNIPHIGVNTAKVLLKNYPLDTLPTLSEDELKSVPGIGEERARAIADALKERKEEIGDFLSVVEISHSAENNEQKKPTICFTGKMPEKRGFYEDLAAKLGYEPVDSVTKLLTLLVSSEPDNTSGKTLKAKKLNIKTITLNDFLELQPFAVEKSTIAPKPSTPVAIAPPQQPSLPESPPQQLELGF